MYFSIRAMLLFSLRYKLLITVCMGDALAIVVDLFATESKTNMEKTIQSDVALLHYQLVLFYITIIVQIFDIAK